MRYLMTYEDMANFENSEILKELLDILRDENKIIKRQLKTLSWDTTKGSSSIYAHIFYPDSGILWVLFKISGKNRSDVVSNEHIYNLIMKELKTKLENNKYISEVTYKNYGRSAMFKMDGKYGTRLAANECIYDVKIYIKEDVVPLIIDEIEMHQNTNKYNL